MNSEVVSKLSGVVLVGTCQITNMTPRHTMEIAKEYPERIVGVVTQYRIDFNGLINMTPGINKETAKKLEIRITEQ